MQFRFSFTTTSSTHDFETIAAARAAWIGLPHPRPHVEMLTESGAVPCTESRPGGQLEGHDGPHWLAPIALPANDPSTPPAAA